jgi:hypothetical protein
MPGSSRLSEIHMGLNLLTKIIDPAIQDSPQRVLSFSLMGFVHVPEIILKATAGPHAMSAAPVPSLLDIGR